MVFWQAKDFGYHAFWSMNCHEFSIIVPVVHGCTVLFNNNTTINNNNFMEILLLHKYYYT